MIKRKPGKFIVIEGVDFSGKTTFAQQLERVLGYRDFNVISNTRLPGTGIAESIRKAIVNNNFSDKVNALLFAANRLHIKETVLDPIVTVGGNVICTRWRWSNDVYQDQPELSALVDEAVGKVEPDLYILLEVSEDIANKALIKRDESVDYVENADGAIDLLDEVFIASHELFSKRFLEQYEKHNGLKYKLTYNEGTKPPTDREFIEKYKPMLELLGYFDKPEFVKVYHDEVETKEDDDEV